MEQYQQTIKSSIHLSGIGIHTGQSVEVSILSAKEDTGIIFKRVDLSSKDINNQIKASFENVNDTKMCTVISNGDDVSVKMVEHIMSAFWGLGIDNAIVELNSSEMPVMDGSSHFFVSKINEVGIQVQSKKREYIKILKKFTYQLEDKEISVEPSEEFSIEMDIEFENTAIGKQSYEFKEGFNHFASDISMARTFGFFNEFEYLKKNGLARGASLENVIAIDGNCIMNKEGLRYSNEFVRHKLLDCIGDLYLAGKRIKGKFKVLKAGHTINNMFLRNLFASEENFCIAKI